MRLLALLAIILFTTSASDLRTRQLLGPQAELFERALAQAGLSTADVRIDPHDMGFFGGDKYRLPFFDALMDNPWKVSPYFRTLGDQLTAPETTMPTTLMSMQLRLDQGIRLNLLGDPMEKYAQRVAAAGDNALDVALAELWGSQSHEPRSHDDLAVVPKRVREAAALYLFALPDILRYRHLALKPAYENAQLKPEEAYAIALSMLAQEEEDDENSKQLGDSLNLEALADGCDFSLLNAGATLTAFVTERMEQLLTEPALELSTAFSLQIATPYGLVVLAGVGPDTHRDQREYLLIIDTGGNDQYGACAAASTSTPVSAVLDVAGDDIYSNVGSSPSFGAGIFGYGVLSDSAGNDTYESQFASQGCGIFGTGVLWDKGGDDAYSAVSASQGSGAFGTGLLLDWGGSDSYDCYQLSQGFGYTLGAGLLLDSSGNDVYTANDTEIRYPSAQSAEHNSSLCQGMGMGRRADYTDGHSWAGGVGLLVDGGGDDKYACAVFGQGCAYWYGVGALLDRAGADQYSGLWYAQGAGAHFGLAALQDDGGDDKYTATMNMAQGAGHDFTLGWLEDSAGNDSYSAPNLSLGGGNANGIGVFWDKTGDDSYLSSGVTLGAAGGIASPSLRQWMLNLGVFVDGGGVDSYWENKGPDADPQPWDFAGDSRAWQRPGMSEPEMPNEFGVGVDG
jgi:hypothetical protein